MVSDIDNMDFLKVIYFRPTKIVNNNKSTIGYKFYSRPEPTWNDQSSTKSKNIYFRPSKIVTDTDRLSVHKFCPRPEPTRHD